MKKQIELLDASNITAAAIKKILAQHNLLNSNQLGKKHFYVSDYTDSFAAHAKQFFSNNIQLEYYPLTHYLMETTA